MLTKGQQLVLSIFALPFLFSNCSDETLISPVAQFELTDNHVAINEMVTVINQSVEAENINWYVNDLLRASLFNDQHPTLMFDTPGIHEIKLVATSTDGLKDSITQSITVDYLTITSISLTKLFEDFKLWDPDSIGDKQLPDVTFRRQIGSEILFESETYWNVTQTDLPINIKIPDDWEFEYAIPIVEFLFYDDDFTSVEPMYISSFGLDTQYDNVLNTGQTTVVTGGIEYLVGFGIQN